MRAWLICLLCLIAPAAADAQASGPIDSGRMSGIVKMLASAQFEGRAPGTPGEARTVAWLIERLRAIGVAPGGEDGSYVQKVPLIRTRLPAGVAATIGGTRLAQGKEIYLNTVRPAERLAIDRAPLVFVGYGVSAPERGWDDFKGFDLAGKVAVFLVNDPDFAADASEPVAGKFGGRRETYYGRWTYKYEEAARRGAIGALIVHDSAGAGYGWETVIAGGGENYDIVRGAADRRVAIQGWIERAAAGAVFAGAGLDIDALSAAARRADFRPVPLGALTFSIETPVTVAHIDSANVLARILGAKRPNETLMFGAHWDAYGIGAPDANGRTIRAGAADDAIGVAGVLELARAFKAGPRPDRTIVFALWTGEERGLLGSEAYAARPLYPLAKTVANLTMDVLQTAGPARDVVLVGDGQSGLDDLLARAAAAQHRTITPEALPERGLYFRADHFSVARRGVPSLLLMGMSGGHDLVSGGRVAGDAWLAEYMKCYHQPCDLWSPTWDLRGATQDVALLYAMGRKLAFGHAWPEWRAGSEFGPIRAASAAERR